MRPLLEVSNYIVQVQLGCTPAEQAMPQEVRFTVLVQFSTAPKGEENDQLDNTLCYAQICEHILKTSQEKKYHLIEHLCSQVYKSLKKLVDSSTRMQVCVHKVRPPVEHLAGGTRYTVGDQFH